MTCDGCAVDPPVTPLEIDNRPGLPRIATRVGSFSTFRRTMLDRIASKPELAGLTTRDPDDHAIAVLEQWAAVADVLTFYSERYANESYLRTATLDENAARLVRLIGYRPLPGTSATTTLVFTLAAGAAVSIDAGFQVQSVPAPGDVPQTYEALTTCAADARLNALPARPATQSVDPLRNSAGGLLDLPIAANPALVPTVGTPLVLVSEGSPGAVTPCRVAGVVVVAEQVRVTLTAPPAGSAPADAYRPRRDLRVFGQDAPATSSPLMTTDSSALGGVTWTMGGSYDLSLSGSQLPLDRTYDDIAVGTKLLVHVPGDQTEVVEVIASDTSLQSLTDTNGNSGLEQSVTVLTLSGDLPDVSDRRTLRITELAGDKLGFSALDYVAELSDEVWIPGVATDLTSDGVQVALPPAARGAAPVVSPADFASGRAVVIADPAGHSVEGSVMGIARREPSTAVAGDSSYLVVPVSMTGDELAALDPQTAVLYGNAVAASNGRTVAAEVLGSGDASQPFQRFTLAKSPLTRLPAPVESGSTPEITVTVDGAIWTPATMLLSAGDLDESFELRTDDAGDTAVQFGDGVNGARPTSGAGNIVATYRYGAGVAGRVGAGRLTQAAQRPSGFTAVTNPVGSQGGSDGEGGNTLRTRAPGTVRVVGRAVSAADCADLLVATALVAKAAATTLWDGRGLVIGVTVAADGGEALDPSHLATLAGVITANSPPYRRVVVASYTPVPIAVTLTVSADAHHDAATVLADVRAAVAARLSFDATTLASPLHLSDLYLAAYTVTGVANIDVTAFGFRRPDGSSDAEWAGFLAGHGADGDPLPERLRFLATLPGTGPGSIAAAELPTLADADLVATIAAAPPAPATGGLT